MNILVRKVRNKMAGTVGERCPDHITVYAADHMCALTWPEKH